MADHIDIGEVYENKIVRRVTNFFLGFFRDGVDGHLRSFVKEYDISSRRNDDPLFPLHDFRVFSVEEEAHVTRLFRLRDLGLFQVMPCNDFAQGVFDGALRRKGNMNAQILLVFYHRGKMKSQVIRHRKFVEAYVRQALGKFAFSFAPDVIVYNGISFFQSSRRQTFAIKQNERRECLIIFAIPICIFNCTRHDRPDTCHGFFSLGK